MLPVVGDDALVLHGCLLFVQMCVNRLDGRRERVDSRAFAGCQGFTFSIGDDYLAGHPNQAGAQDVGCRNNISKEPRAAASGHVGNIVEEPVRTGVSKVLGVDDFLFLIHDIQCSSADKVH